MKTTENETSSRPAVKRTDLGETKDYGLLGRNLDKLLRESVAWSREGTSPEKGKSLRSH